jgi:hypothetical protein
MNESSINPDQEPQLDGMSSETDGFAELEETVRPDAVDVQMPGPSLGDTFGVRGTWLLWLFAAVVILGGLACAILVFVLLSSGEETKPTPTATQSIVLTASTPKPTQTQTATLTRHPTASATPTATATASATPTITPTPTPTPDVVLLGIKALGELNTVRYDLETVVEKKRIQERGFPWSDRVLHFLLVAGGRVKAGLDFAKVVRYEIDDDKVTVFLSAPRITDYSVDSQSLEIYYIRDDGLDEKLAIEAYNEAIVEAQESLREAALRSDILETAKTNATALVQSLILGLGFSEVTVEFLPPEGGETLELEQPLELIPTLAPFPTATTVG